MSHQLWVMAEVFSDESAKPEESRVDPILDWAGCYVKQLWESFAKIWTGLTGNEFH